MYSYASAIFNRCLDTIEEHKSEHVYNSPLTTYGQALDWWANQPDFVQLSMQKHSHMESTKDINDFYWGEE